MKLWKLMNRKYLHTKGLVCACATGTLLASMVPASADIIYSTGNNQYFNVNIAADINALSVIGDIGNTGLQMTFNTMLGPQTFGGAAPGQVTMHCQHGVAFCESFLDSTPGVASTGFSSITLSAVTGAWTAGDFALDELGRIDGTVTFSAFLAGAPVPFSGSDQFTIDATGQNPFNFFTFNGETIDKLVITMDCTSAADCFNLADIKQVSLLPQGFSVPEPSTLALFGAGLTALGVFGLRRRRRSAT